MSHSLTLGSLLLVDSVPDAQYGYVFEVMADGATFGVAQSVQEIVRSLLADGELVRTTRSGNREVTFKVAITGPTLGAAAHGEAALRREIGKSNTLTWQAPDVLAVPTVFEVVTSEMAQNFDDLDESLRRRRTFTLTLTCAPHARSAELTTVEGLSVGVGETVVDDCSSATGWEAAVSSPADTLSQSAGAVWVHDATGGNDAMGLRRAASIDVSSASYFRLEWKSHPGPGFTLLGLPAGSDPFPSELDRVLLSDGWMQSTWLVEPGDLDDGFQFAYVNEGSGTQEGDYLGIREVVSTAIPPNVTSRQLNRIIHPGGTERTPCSLEVTPGAFEALGVGIVHTSPEEGTGYSPALRQYRFSGNPVTVDSTLLSGGMEAITGTPIVAQVPLTALAEDTFAIVAFMKSSAVGTFSFTWQARTIVNSTYLGGHEGVTEARFFDADTWTLVPLALVTLPPVRASEGGYVQFNITRTVVDEEIYLDEWWAFRMGDDCALTIVQAFDASFLWLDSADTSSPVPRVWVGGNSDRTDQFHPGADGLIAQGNHVLTPEGTSVFVASTDIEYPNFEVSYYKRWHSNAAE